MVSLTKNFKSFDSYICREGNNLSKGHSSICEKFGERVSINNTKLSSHYVIVPCLFRNNPHVVYTLTVFHVYGTNIIENIWELLASKASKEIFPFSFFD